jgi:hypothetical protein
MNEVSNLELEVFCSSGLASGDELLLRLA